MGTRFDNGQEVAISDHITSNGLPVLVQLGQMTNHAEGKAPENQRTKSFIDSKLSLLLFLLLIQFEKMFFPGTLIPKDLKTSILNKYRNHYWS